MSKVSVSIQLYNERPYGDHIKSPGAEDELKEGLDYTCGVTEVFNEEAVPRTLLFVGSNLDFARDKVGKDELREIHDSDSYLVHLGNHSWSHRPFKQVKEQPDRDVIPLDEIEGELSSTEDVIKDVFGRYPDLVSTPLWYENGLKENPDIVDIFDAMGYRMCTSDARGKDDSLYAGLFDRDGRLRKPFFYGNGVLEIPNHWWQDVAFKHVHPKEKPKDAPMTDDDVIDSLSIYLENSKELSVALQAPIHLQFAFHVFPYMKAYDKDLSLTRRMLRHIRDSGARYVNPEEVYGEMCSRI